MTRVVVGHSMLLRAWQIHGRWRWCTNDGGSAPSRTATLASTSTRGDDDLAGLMHADGDERRRPQLLPALHVDLSMTCDLEVQRPPPGGRRPRRGWIRYDSDAVSPYPRVRVTIWFSFDTSHQSSSPSICYGKEMDRDLASTQGSRAPTQTVVNPRPSQP
jgi:hypothetical protein